MTGLGPVTSSLPMRCATTCATSACRLSQRMIVYYMTTVVVNKKQIENAIKKIMFKNQLYIRSLSQQIDNRRIVADILERIKTPC